MSSLPLHPAIVHLPLGLAFVIPMLALALVWGAWTGRISWRGWLAIVALQALLVGGGLAAANTGEREEERVKAVVPETAIERHEAYAGQFLWAAGATLGLAALVLVFRRPTARRALASATVVGTLVVAGSAVRLGRAGGELVYIHNAGAAYAVTAAGGTSTAERVEANAAGQRAGQRHLHEDD